MCIYIYIYIHTYIHIYIHSIIICVYMYTGRDGIALHCLVTLLFIVFGYFAYMFGH